MRRHIRKLVREGNTVDPNLHPEDRSCQLTGVQDARLYGREWCEAHKEEIFAAILVYADSAGDDIFAALREDFWTTDFRKKRGKR